jgi:D-beta-D-heptose 7-phosphate kinase/D-beta-D-heptose 1-phosphate adenosyltransferase
MTPNFQGFSATRVLVVGDCMLDRYLQGTVSRISPEAPVGVLSVERTMSTLGGAANVAAGVAALGGRTTLAGIIGCDPDGAELSLLVEQAGIECLELIEGHETTTICKTRAIAGQHHQLLRLDQDGSKASRAALAKELQSRVLKLINEHDVVVFADYEKGTLPASLLQTTIAAAAREGIPVIVDPKKLDFTAYAGATVLTPNVTELERATGRSLPTTMDIEGAAKEVITGCGILNVLCTRASDGMLWVSAEDSMSIAAEQRNVADVTGAGDTVVAALSVGIGSHWPMADCCHMSNIAAGLAVSRPRTYIVSSNELQHAWSRGPTKLIDTQTAITRADACRKAGQRIVFTNGCFDVLHAGHLATLEAAKRCGDVLVLALNSDESVRQLKGPARPVLEQSHRAALLAGLECVDMIVVFDEPTPEALVRRIKPDVLVKGSDYQADEISGSEFVRQYGGEVVLLPLVQGLSSTKILQRGGIRAAALTTV